MTRTDDETPTQARDRDAVERGDGERGKTGRSQERTAVSIRTAVSFWSWRSWSRAYSSLWRRLATSGWQAAVTTADGVPTATVEAIEPMPAPDDDRRQVTVRLDNQDGTGLSSVQVAVRCGDSERSLAFEHVPAGGRRTGTVVCPAGTAPISEVVAWVRV